MQNNPLNKSTNKTVKTAQKISKSLSKYHLTGKTKEQRTIKK